MWPASIVAICAALSSTVIAIDSSRPTLQIWKGHRATSSVGAASNDPSTSRTDASAKKYPAQYFTQKTTHFPTISPQPLTNKTFQQRWWFDAQYYKPGGPVFVLDGGETSGEGRLPFFQRGILGVLAKATEGMSVVLEHRFYGESFPFGDLSISSLEYLDTAQTLADSAHFVKNVVFPGFEHVDLTAGKTPYIYYGGSYAGAKAAFMRSQYPNLIWGAIASSAVTHAVVDYWEYFDVIRRKADQDCSNNLVEFTSFIDEVLEKNVPSLTKNLKSFFHLGNVTDDRDFVNTLTYPLGAWQGRNWDSKVNDPDFGDFCNFVLKPNSSQVLPSTQALEKSMKKHDITFPKQLSVANFKRYALYISSSFVDNVGCKGTQDQCYGTTDPEAYKLDGLDNPYRAWFWQVCTQYGYFATGAPKGTPSIASRLLDVKYNAEQCTAAFRNAVPKLPKVNQVNKYGSYSLSYPRLAFIDGSDDPWRQTTPHSTHALTRQDTMSEPFKLIPGAVHHWDENSLGSSSNQILKEPKAIRQIHQEEIGFVKTWLKDFKDQKQSSVGKGKVNRIVIQ